MTALTLLLSRLLLVVWMFQLSISLNFDLNNTCSCRYTVELEMESPYCRVYGQLGDDVLIPWYMASYDCLNAYDIKVAFIDTDHLLMICPYPNSTNVSVSALISEIRNNNNPATNAIMSYYDEWFTTSGSTGKYYIKQNITDEKGTYLDCSMSPTLCWNAIKEYFTNNSNETGTLCKEFHNRHMMNLELQQSIIRGRLCQELETDPTTLLGNSTNSNTSTTTNSSNIATTTTARNDETDQVDHHPCAPLARQILEIKESTEYSNKYCSAYELGPGNRTLPPKCLEQNYSSTIFDDNNGDAFNTNTNTNKEISSNGGMLFMNYNIWFSGFLGFVIGLYC